MLRKEWLKIKVDQTLIKPSHQMYKIIKDFSMRSKNMYNYANYIVRQEFIKSGKWIRYQQLQKDLKDSEPYKTLMSQSSQCVLQVLDRNWKSFFNATKEYVSNPSKFLGRPKIPKYLPKDKGWVWFLKNNNTYIKDGRLYFRLKAMEGYSFKVNTNGRLIAVRFVPNGKNFVLEVIYETFTPSVKSDSGRYLSVDLGVDNFATMTNNIGKPPVIIKGGYIKSTNQFYNKNKARHQSLLPNSVHWSKKLDEITLNRYNKIKNWMHHTSNFIVKYCIENDISCIVVGLNQKWKQEVNLGNKNNQSFVMIPYDIFIKQLEYKGLDVGILVIKTEESYTSGTSFLDGEAPIKDNYNKDRRVKRGLFKSNSGVLINSDVNGSLQIMKKVKPNAYDSYGLWGCLNPLVIKCIFDY